MSLPQKNKYSGVSQNIQQQARVPHSIQHRGPAPVQVSRTEDYRQLHNFSLRGSGVAVTSGAGGGGPVGAHDMSKTLGSQGGPPGTTAPTMAGIYASGVAGGPGSQMGGPQGAPLAPPPVSQSGAPPPGVVQGQHLTASLPPYYTRQGQPPQVAPPQAQPPQVQGGQSVQGVPQGPPQGAPQRQVSGGATLGRPPPTVQGALGPMGLPANSPQGPSLATAYSAAQLLNYQGQPTAAYQTQHIPQQMIISNCAAMPLQAYPSQRASQFSTAPQLFYQPYVQHPQQAAMYYTSPQMQMTMGGAAVPPAAQAPRGQHTPPAGAAVLTSRSKRPLAIVDPSTGRNILEDKDIASPGASAEASRSTPPSDLHSSSGSDIAGVFAAQVAAAAASTAPPPAQPPAQPPPQPPPQPPRKPTPPAVVPPEPPLPVLAPQEPPVVTEDVTPPLQQSPDDGIPPADVPPAETEAVEEEEQETLAEVVVPPADAIEADTVVDSVDRTPVVVGVEEKREEKVAAGEAINSEPVEAVAVPEVSATVAPAEVSKDVSKEAPEGRESKKASKRKKMKEWNKKGESKEGGDMDAFVVKEELPQQPPQQRAPTPVHASPVRTPSPPVVAPQVPSVEVVDVEDEEHRRQVVMKNEENIRVSREAALKEEAAIRGEGPVEPVEVTSPPAESEEPQEEVAVEEEEEEEEEAEEVEEDTGEPVELKTALKYNYRDDQWSPLNPEGRKMYDRSFLLELQGEPMSLQKPFGLPNLDVIKDTVTQHRLPDVQRYSYPPMQVPGGVGQGRNHPEHLFMPSYARNGVARPPMGGGGGAGGGGVGRRQSQPGRGGEKPKKVITLSSSLNQEVKLHAAEKAWKPKHKVPLKAMVEDVGAEELYRRVRGILNKLTPQKFQSLVEQVRGLEINSEDRLNRVIDLVFEKALDEPNFSVPYANMCKQLAMFEVPMRNGGENQMVNFRKLLLHKCQGEFEKDANDEINKDERLKQIKETTSEEERNRMVAELAEDEKRFKRRSLGNIRFIGELYNLNMLTAPIMFDCLRRLLNSKDEDSLECLCKLLITIGKELDNTSAKGGQGGKGYGHAQLDDCFRTMEGIVKKREVSLRVVFMLQDVIDLRTRRWVPRRDENIPKTIDQIHEEAQREQVHEKLMRDSMAPQRRDDRGDRGDRGDRRKNRGGGGGGSYDDGGWNTVPSKKHVDVNKLKQINTKPTEMDSIQLGPASRMSSWAKGSSGGSKAANQEPETRPAANRFSALADTPTYDSRRSTQRSTASSRESSRGRGSIGPGPTTPSGVRKVPSQSRERDSALAAVKNLASMTSSLDASTEPTASSATQPPAARDEGTASAKESELVLKGSPTMDEDVLKTRTEALVDQFLCNSDFQDAVQNVTELVAPSNVVFFISTAINHVLERSFEARALVGQLLKDLVRRKVVTLELFTKGLHEVLQYGEDIELDIPKVWEYVAELLVPLFEDSWLPMSYLREASEPCKANGRAARMVASVLTLLAKMKGEANVADLWRTSSLQWEDFLGPNDDADSFFKANNVAWAATSGSRSLSSTSMAEVEAELNLLICAKKVQPPEILFWIEKNLDESFTKKPQFIRALVSVIAKNAITVHRDGNASLNADLLKSYFDLLQRYVDNQEEHELQALYGLQALMNKLEHPKGILVSLFNSFYDGDLISEDAFMQWKQSEDPAEQEGKGVALKSATSFFTWLSEMDGESGDED